MSKKFGNMRMLYKQKRFENNVLISSCKKEKKGNKRIRNGFFL